MVFGLATFALSAVIAASHAASFGSHLIAYNVRVQSLFDDAYGAIYVPFTLSNLIGCNGSYGVYLSSAWTEAMVGSPSGADSPRMQLAMTG
jgi:hypothetical protein